MGEYELFEEGGSLLVKWMSPTLPVEIKVIALFFLATLPFLFVFRGPFARFADRHLHIHWSPKAFGIVAPAISLLCGVLLFFVREPSEMIYWDLETTGVSVKSPNGTATMAWDEMNSATLDEQRLEKSTLVFQTKTGRELWLVLSWLEPEHQEEILDFINQSTQNKFNLPVELPAPTEPHKE